MLKQHTDDNGFRHYTDASDNELLGVTTAIGGVSTSFWRLLRWYSSLEREYQVKIAKRAFETCIKKGYTDYGFAALMQGLTQAEFAGDARSKLLAGRGTKAHKEIEKWIESNRKGVATKKITPAIDAAAAFLYSVGLPDNQETEVQLEDPEHGFAGTCDYPVIIQNLAGKELVIVDWKNGRDKYVSHGMQLSAYAVAAEKKYGLRVRSAFAVYLSQRKYQKYSPSELKPLFQLFLTHLTAVRSRWHAERDSAQSVSLCSF